jgi:hypothetical protein
LNIIQEEGFSDGGPVVEDCLNLFLSLLRNNTSNQTIFREGNYTKRILPFFDVLNEPAAATPWRSAWLGYAKSVKFLSYASSYPYIGVALESYAVNAQLSENHEDFWSFGKLM